MTFRIDTGIPRVWRTPHSLQYGIDEPLAVLERVSVGHERMLELLTVGTPRTGLEAMGSQHGLTTREVDEFIATLGPVLATPAPSITRPRVVLTGNSPTAGQIARLLASGGCRVARVGDTNELRSTPADLGIAVGHFVLSPELHGAWLRRDIPHLPVVFGDRTVRVGPLVEPGLGPCLYCLERFRTDADPAWPAIASQLWGRRSPLESALLAAEVAVLAARLALERLAGAPSDPAASIAARATESITIDTRGRRVDERHEVHPECGCNGWGEVIALPRKARPARARRGTATARAPRAARNATTSRAAADAPA
ncbi:MAG: hypothetical protein KF680_02505 [Cryobacterium sp.]|nr:hypothetical protein [Cryobacterium sp.]